jgi:hypothetical protein
MVQVLNGGGRREEEGKDGRWKREEGRWAWLKPISSGWWCYYQFLTVCDL